MILLAQDGLEVVKYGNYDDQNPRMGRFVDLRNGETTFRFTVLRDLADSIPSPGTVVSVALEAYRRPAARKDRNGDAYVKWETKYRVVSFDGAKGLALAEAA